MTIHWYVNGDPDNTTFDTKIEAEARARKVFPDEDIDKRYARIHFKELDFALPWAVEVRWGDGGGRSRCIVDANGNAPLTIGTRLSTTAAARSQPSPNRSTTPRKGSSHLRKSRHDLTNPR